MTNKDFELILIEGFLQTPETRVDFYFSKAEDNNCSPVNFCTSLIETYRRLFNYVNSVDHTTWEVDETGEKYPTLNTINLHSFTNGLYLGNLDNENITELLPSLLKMAKLLMPKDEAEKLVKQGFKSSLTKVQIQSLFELLKGKFIDINTDPSHFTAIFSPDPFPNGFKPVKWLLGKNALRELLISISTYKNKDNEIYIPDEVSKRFIPNVFIDKKGIGIELNKPKKGEYSNHYIKIEAIIKGL